MAALNPFDQFDTPATAAPAALANPFDQFDATAGRPQSPETTPAPAGPEGVGRLETAGSEFARGLAAIGSGTLKGLAISSARDTQRMLPLFDAIDQGEDVPLVAAPQAFGGFLLGYKDAGPDERRAIRQMFAQVAEPRTSPLFEAGAKLDAFVARHTNSNPEFAEEFFAGKLPRGFGSMTGFMAAGIATRGIGVPAVIAPAILGSLVNRTDTFEDALRNGASIEDAYKASDFGAVVGLSEAAPIALILSRLDKTTGGSIKRGLTALLLGGTEELVQEVGQNIFNNLIASDLVAYDPERDMFVGTDDAAGVGFTTGAVMGFLTSLVGGRRGRSVQQRPTAPVTPADEASPIPTHLIAEGRAIVQEAEAGTIPAGAVPADVVIGATPDADAEAAIAEAAGLVERAKRLVGQQAEQAAALAEIEAGVQQLEQPGTQPAGTRAPVADEPVVVRPAEAFGGRPVPPETATEGDVPSPPQPLPQAQEPVPAPPGQPGRPRRPPQRLPAGLAETNSEARSAQPRNSCAPRTVGASPSCRCRSASAWNTRRPGGCTVSCAQTVT